MNAAFLKSSQKYLCLGMLKACLLYYKLQSYSYAVKKQGAGMIKNNRTCVDNEALIKIYIKLVLCIATVCVSCDTLLVYIS